jgi:hypothetical protein
LQPKSQSDNPSPRHSAARNAQPRSARRHLDHAPHRPDHYEVEHRRRRVIVAGVPDDYSPPAPDEASGRPARPRRASLLKKMRCLRFGPWEWVGLGVSILACGLLIGEIAAAQSDHHMLRVAVREKTDQLESLEKQRREDGKKLAYLKSEKGREQILAERGYLKPGDRILLFSPDPKTNAAPVATSTP